VKIKLTPGDKAVAKGALLDSRQGIIRDDGSGQASLRCGPQRLSGEKRQRGSEGESPEQ
jgi:hypothetical protein